MGDVVLHVRIADRKLVVAAGPLPTADLAIETGPAIRLLLSRELSAHDAVARRLVKITGDTALLEQFTRLFRIEAIGHGGQARH